MIIKKFLFLYSVLSLCSMLSSVERPGSNDKAAWIKLVNQSNVSIFEAWSEGGVGIPKDQLDFDVNNVNNGGLSLVGFQIDISNPLQVRSALKRRFIWLDWMAGANHSLIWRTYPSEFYSDYFPSSTEIGSMKSADLRRTEHISVELLLHMVEHFGELQDALVGNNEEIAKVMKAGKQSNDIVSLAPMEYSTEQLSRIAELEGANVVLNMAIYSVKNKSKAFLGMVEDVVNLKSPKMAEVIQVLGRNSGSGSSGKSSE